MSTLNRNTKQPFKLIQLPLSKFQNEVIPHHQALFESHKNHMQKLLVSQNFQQIYREVRDKRQVVKQLKDLTYQLDTLRTQVEDLDLGTFDAQTVSLRKTILELIRNYASLETKVTEQMKEYPAANDNNETGHQQIQIYDNLTELKVREKEDVLNRVEALNKDIEDVQEIFHDLNQMVVQQKEYVNNIESNVEVANENVSGGLRHLIKASSLKRASYPVTGAFIGTLIGGPIGSVAGLKIGGLAAVSCGLLGYISGRFIKKTGNIDISTRENSEEVIKNIENSASKENIALDDKKDI